MDQVTPNTLRASRSPSWFRRNGVPLASFQEEFDQLMNRFGRGFRHELEDLVPGPNADLQETDSAFVVTVDMPGFEEKDVDVTLTDNRLTIKGRNVRQDDKQDGDYHFTERRNGDVSRMVTLPCEIDAYKVEAAIKNGVLTVTLPKSTASKAQTKHIKVKRVS